MLFFTYVVRPGEAPEGRGPRSSPFWQRFSMFDLRVGMLLQLVGLVGLVSCARSYGAGGASAFLSYLGASKEAMGSSPIVLVQVFGLLRLLGCVSVLTFELGLDDDSSIKQVRGFRLGAKMLNVCSSLGVVSALMQLLAFAAAATYRGDEWMGEHDAASRLFLTARLLDVLSLYLTGNALWCLESYHNHGVGAVWAWLLLGTFELAGLAQLVALITGCGAPSALYVWSAITAITLATLWSAAFEPLSHRYDVKLTQSSMRNEYYKSRNAMAYYGPAVVNNDGEIDIQAAAQQAQACFNA